MEKGVSITLDTFKKAVKHKDLKIVYGTDANAGAHGQNYREFIVRVRDGGQDPMQALISATSLSAESLNLGKEIGSIAPGMQADIVGFDGDPLKDVYAASRAVFVMKSGKVYENVARGSNIGWHEAATGSRKCNVLLAAATRGNIRDADMLRYRGVVLSWIAQSPTTIAADRLAAQ